MRSCHVAHLHRRCQLTTSSTPDALSRFALPATGGLDAFVCPTELRFVPFPHSPPARASATLARPYERRHDIIAVQRVRTVQGNTPRRVTGPGRHHGPTAGSPCATMLGPFRPFEPFGLLGPLVPGQTDLCPRVIAP